jgi:hypothetical protein
MASLFEGQPKTATSYVQSTSEMPKWMQDAVYNQIQVATNLANKPYQEYQLSGESGVAQLTPLQQAAYSKAAGNAGVGFTYDAQGNVTGTQFGTPAHMQNLNTAMTSMEGFGTKGTAADLQAAQNRYLRQDLVGTNLDAGQDYWKKAGGLDVVGAAQPALSRAMQQDITGAAQPYLQRAAAQDVMGAAQPYLNQAGTTTAQSLAERALTAASPYLQSAGQTAASQVGQYMSPYQQGVLDVIAKQGARNLSENLLPQVSDAFIKAGQFGSNRMGEFGSRAVRDTQEAILNQQAQAAQQGYGQSLQAAQADLARQAQLAGTVGSISGADLSRILQGGAQYGNLGQTAGQLTAQQAGILANLGQTAGQLTGQQMAQLTNLGQVQGQLTSQQMQNLANLGQMQTTAGQAQQQFGLTAAQQAQQAQAQDYARQMQAYQNMAGMAQQQQTMGLADTASLEAAGRAQQQQGQRNLDAERAEYEAQQLYPRQQMDWLSTQIRGMAPITPTATSGTRSSTGEVYAPSPLSTLATGLYTGKGLGVI